jgi:hypothetical protein
MSLIEPNGVRFDPESKGHVESYFLKINDPQKPRALWIKATILKKLDAPPVAEAWAVAFDREKGHTGHKTVVPFASAQFSRGPDLDVDVAGTKLGPEHATGAVGDVAWDFAFAAHAPPIYLYGGPRMYTGKLPSQKSLSSIPDLTTTGTVKVRGETWDVGGWRGSLGHNWGTRHTHLYAWGQISSWDKLGTSPENASDLVFEAGTGRVKVGPIVVPPLTVIAVRFRGVRYEWNSLADLRSNRGAIHSDLRRWTFSGRNALGSIEGELHAETRDFVGLGYENPNGAMTYCLNSKIAHARIQLSVSGRAPLEATSSAAALEIGTRDPKHGVVMVA